MPTSQYYLHVKRIINPLDVTLKHYLFIIINLLNVGLNFLILVASRYNKRKLLKRMLYRITYVEIKHTSIPVNKAILVHLFQPKCSKLMKILASVCPYVLN